MRRLKLKKLLLIITSVLVCLTMFGLLLFQQVSAAEYNWRFAHEELETGFMHNSALEFKKQLEELSNGRIHLDIYSSGQLGESKDLVELVQQGAIQFNFADAGHIGTIVSEEQVFLLHYLFPENIDIVWEVLKNGEVLKILDKDFEKKNLKSLGKFTEGWQVWTANKPLRKPADFKGFKMRTMTSRLILDAYKAYGANPTPTPFSEVYSNLQLKMVDGQENPIFCIEEMHFYEVQDYLINGYCNPFVLTLITNNDYYSKLPDDIKNIIRESVERAREFSIPWLKEATKKRLEIMLEERPNLKYIELTHEEKEAFAKLAEPVRNTYIGIPGGDEKEVLNTLLKDIEKASK